MAFEKSMNKDYSIPLGKHVTYHGCRWIVYMQGMSTSHHVGANTGERYYWLIHGPGEVLMVPAHFLETELLNQGSG